MRRSGQLIGRKKRKSAALLGLAGLFMSLTLGCCNPAECSMDNAGTNVVGTETNSKTAPPCHEQTAENEKSGSNSQNSDDCEECGRVATFFKSLKKAAPALLGLEFWDVKLTARTFIAEREIRVIETDLESPPGPGQVRLYLFTETFLI